MCISYKDYFTISFESTSFIRYAYWGSFYIFLYIGLLLLTPVLLCRCWDAKTMIDGGDLFNSFKEGRSNFSCTHILRILMIYYCVVKEHMFGK